MPSVGDTVLFLAAEARNRLELPAIVVMVESDGERLALAIFDPACGSTGGVRHMTSVPPCPPGESKAMTWRLKP